MKEKRNITKDTEMVKKFLKKHTNHQAETAVLSRGRKSTYKVRVQDQHSVKREANVWIIDGHLAFGVVGFGICSCVPLSTLE